MLLADVWRRGRCADASNAAGPHGPACARRTPEDAPAPVKASASYHLHAGTLPALPRPQEGMTMLPSAIVIPTGLLGSVLEPAALFAVWGVVVVGVLAGLSAALGRHPRAAQPKGDTRPPRPRGAPAAARDHPRGDLHASAPYPGP